eukprot:Skav225250  [mRNA]  locus=scaffold988:59215:60126:- [translate_table: standard]
MLLGGAVSRGNAPLHDAARHGHVAVVNLLVEAGAALDSENDKGWGPRWEDLGWIGFLAVKGSSALNFSTLAVVALRSGETPLSLAKQEGNTDVVKVLEAELHGFQSVQLAAASSVQVLQVISPSANDLLTAVLATFALPREFCC